MRDFFIEQFVDNQGIIYSKDKKILLSVDESIRKSITSIVIPIGINRIEDKAFLGCTSLTNVEIPDTVISIGCQAFSCCDSLTTITFPNSVRDIEDWCFSCSPSLRKIYVPAHQRNRFLRMKGLKNFETEYRKIIEEENVEIQLLDDNCKCIKCGRLFLTAYAFCPYCGSAKVHTCPNPICGNQNIPSEAIFCPECGSKL